MAGMLIPVEILGFWANRKGCARCDDHVHLLSLQVPGGMIGFEWPQHHEKQGMQCLGKQHSVTWMTTKFRLITGPRMAVCVASLLLCPMHP